MDNKRLKNLQSKIRNPILIKKKENLFYLTGRNFDHRAEEYLLLKPSPRPSPRGRGGLGDAVAFGSGLEQIDWLKKADRLKNIGKYLKGVKKLDIEYGFTYGEGEYLKQKIKDYRLKIKLEPSRSTVDRMRMIKESDEIALVKKSMEIVERVFKLVRSEIKKPGMSEIRLAQFIQSAGLKLGAEDISFPAIVASGANAAIPHHVPSAKKLKAGESIIIDFGFKYKNYCSDFTRTVFLKSIQKRLADAYEQVEKAYLGSMEFISVGADLIRPQEGKMRSSPTAGAVYQKSVQILAEKNLDKYFIHSLGHGTGLEIHELPNLSPNSKDIMQDGMVFSIEPGVYFPKIGGIRIEDLVYLENGKVKKFINVPTKLAENIF